MTKDKGGEGRPEHLNADGKSTVIDAYKAGDTHTEQTSGYRNIGEYPNDQRTCDECGMVARNDEELQSHLQAKHN